MWKWLILGGLILLLVFFIGSFVAVYRGLFTVKHYREVAVALEKLRQGAKESPWVEGIEPELGDFTRPGDSRVALTSCSLGITYSITGGEFGYRHHIAVSTPKAGHTTHAAGEAFVSFFVWRLGLEPELCESYAGPAAHHLQFTIEEGQEAALMSRALTLPDDIDFETIREEIQRIRERIDFFNAVEVIAEEQAERESIVGEASQVSHRG